MFRIVAALAWPLLTPTSTTPILTAVTTPEEFTVAMLESDVVQVPVELTSLLDPSLRVAWAENCRVLPTVTAEFCGVNEIDVADGELDPFELDDPEPRQPTRVMLNSNATTRAKNLDIGLTPLNQHRFVSNSVCAAQFWAIELAVGVARLPETEQKIW